MSVTDSIVLPTGMQVFQRGWLSSNNILLTGPDGNALVDSGYISHAAQTVALVEHALNTVDPRRAQLDLLLNTHLHSDHCGGNAALQRRYGCRTLIPAAEAAKVREWNEDALSFSATGQRCERFGFDDTYASGQTLQLGTLTWQALGAPGHDPHSLILYCASEGILISADALWEHGFGVIFPELDGESGFAETAATLELIASLAIRLVIPGHGAPFSDVKAALSRAFARLEYLRADPVRNAQNGVKVLLKFLLLEHGRLACGQIPQLLGGMRVFNQANQRFLQLTDADAAQWASAQLVKVGAAELHGDWLVDRS
ncbi:MAG: MBL fold metallo-hydrolase [Pseudomonadota bacterium]|nr:MBL fold metallo-hydrolase [Pseudomonadota bacterium]